MIEALHGRDGLGLGLLIDQLGSYLALSTLDGAEPPRAMPPDRASAGARCCAASSLFRR
jgi:hypothetical protein